MHQLTGGRCCAGTVSRPWTFAFQLWKASSESRCGIWMAYFIVPFDVPAEQVLGRAPGGLVQALHRGELDRLRGDHVRADQSPIGACTTDASAATVKGIVSATRW